MSQMRGPPSLNSGRAGVPYEDRFGHHDVLLSTQKGGSLFFPFCPLFPFQKLV